MSNDWAIKIEHLSKVYKIFDKPTDRVKEALNPFKKRYSKDFYALNDVSLTIKRGETVGIIGKNGAGKSTLLKIITGVLTPTAGNIRVNGRIASLLELGAGFNPEMTGIENIYMNGTIMGYTKEEMDKRLQDIIDFADIGDFINQPVKMYSSGMFARLAFAVNANTNPDILIVDEALSVGDSFFQQKCIYRMKELQKNGTTILFVSHALSTVKAFCDRGIFLKKGSVYADGKADVVCDKYQNETTDISVKRADQEEKETLKPKIEKKNRYFRIDSDLKKRITEKSGGGQVEFTAFDFYLNDQIVSKVTMDDNFCLRISGIAKEDVESGSAVGVLCRDKMGNDLFALNSNFYDVFLPELHKGEKFVLEIVFRIPLAPGEYFFGIGCKPEVYTPNFYTRIFNIGKITVEKSLRYKDAIGGLMFASVYKYEMTKII